MAECLVQVQNSVFINYCQVKIRRETRSSHALQEMTTEVKKEVCLNMWDRYLVNWESRKRKEEGGPELEGKERAQRASGLWRYTEHSYSASNSRALETLQSPHFPETLSWHHQVRGEAGGLLQSKNVGAGSEMISSTSSQFCNK